MKQSRRMYATPPSYDVASDEIQCRADALHAEVFEITGDTVKISIRVLAYTPEGAKRAAAPLLREIAEMKAYEAGQTALDEIVKCWCGVEGKASEMFEECGDDGCGGTGTLNCHCGGDLCVCHNHGEVECPGCPDCDRGDEDGFDDRDWEDE